MIRVAPAAARRIDRLSSRAHRFHRFAHHPLCSEYASEVLRIGRRGRVCKGCAFALVGSLLGVSGGALLNVPPVATVALALGAVALGARGLVASPGGRLGKIASRLLPLFGMTLVSVGALRTHSPLNLAAAVAALCALAVLYFGYRRRGPARGPCAACPERSAPWPCRGLVEIVRRERAFRRLAGRLIGDQVT